MWTADGLANESDVEQKLIYPLLVEASPLGCGLPHSVIQTKSNIRRFQIGKGSDLKLYYPDYLIVALGYPLAVLEAKHPTQSVEEGYREARLYAHELNSLYQHGIAPAQIIVACNGIELWYGYADQVEPIGKAKCQDLGPYAKHLSDLVELLSWKRLEGNAIKIAQSLRPEELFKPRRLLGGLSVQNEEVALNSFGATVTASVAPIFNPITRKDRIFVAKNGYIPSKRRERYIDPIDRVIRAAQGPCESDSTALDDTSSPKELIKKLRTSRELEHQVLLIIGSVGSGKSTFIDHLHEVALPKDLVESTLWCRVNMNAAPVSPNEIYDWLRLQIIDGCRNAYPAEDFDDIDMLEKVLSVEINKFKKGVGKYFSNPDVFSIKLGEHIQELQRNHHLMANAYVRFTSGEKGKLFVIVLDNCDKKTRDEQLLMFEAAQWLQKEFRCLVILPLRDETYDNHRHQPPLDTALKDLVFRIEPPLFQQVLVKRVQLALNEIEGNGNEKLRFSLPNGFTVEYPRSEQAFYLASIVKSLFENDRFVRRMITGLSGRNMRRALEIFLEFCNSGHIGEDQIFKIRQSEGNYSIPFHQVANVLLRMNRRFYDSNNSYIKNVFAANKDDTLPGFFCRYFILQWLRLNFSTAGTSGLKGYFPKRNVKFEIAPYGFSPEILDREINHLLSAQCVIAEHLRTDSVEDDDLIRLGPAGFVHLELVGNVVYLSAISEDTYFLDRIQAEGIAARIRNPNTHYTIKTAVDNASDLINHLEIAKGLINPPNGGFLESNLLDTLCNLSEAKDAIARVEKSQAGDPWFDADRKLPRKSTHHVTIVNSVEYGHFVEFDNGLRGLIHKSNFNGHAVSAGDRVDVEVMWVDVHQRRMGLRLLGLVAEDVGDLVEGSHGTQGNLFQVI